jgi:outer membrane protein assembly factor BamB
MPNLPILSGNRNEKLLQRIAMVAGVFSFTICILMIANYIQLKKADPANMKVITALVEKLSQNPDDVQLRDEIRTLDLLSRKAYFTSQWQIRTGGYLLLAGIAMMIIALQWIALKRKRNPVLTGIGEEMTGTQKKARQLVIYGGLLLLATAFISGFLSYRSIKGKYSDESLSFSVPADTLAGVLPGSAQIPDQTDNQDTAVVNPEDVQAGALPAMIQEENEKMAIVSGPGVNFPTFRGPGGLAVVPQKNNPVDWDGPSGANILWKTVIPLPGYNSPVIWGDKIFLTGASDLKREVYCLDKNNGKIIWTAPVANIPGSPSQVPKVSKETGFAASTAAVNAQGIFAVFPNGDLIALNHEGKQLWAKNLGLPENHYGHSSSLMIYNNLLIIQFDQRSGARIFALSTASGETVWSTNRQVKVSWSSPILVPAGDRMQVITAADPYVAGYDVLTGEELWKLEAISGEVGPSAAFGNGIVFTVNDYSKVVAIKLGAQPEKLWENDEYLSDIPSPVANDEYLFLVTSYGVVVCYDAQTGVKYWEKEFNNPVFSSPVIAEKRVYLMDRSGVMHIFKADKEFIPVGEPKLGERSACTPAFSNGRIYLRGDKTLFCIGKNEK